MTEAKPRRTKKIQGGPRSQAVVEKVHAATLAEIDRAGFAGMTMDGVARAAGINRTTLYRRWPSKADLVADLFEQEVSRLETATLPVDPQAAVDLGISGTFLPHGLGHLLGVQVHDVGGFRPAPDAAPIPRPQGHPALRLTRRLEPGMVVTVEPGLYFIESLLARLSAGPHRVAVEWPLVERLVPYGGIRIEDNVVVTADGGENLTRAAFAYAG